MNSKNKIKYEKAYKITKNKDKNDLIEAKEYFEKPDKYLVINPKIIIGLSPDKRSKTNIKEQIKTLSSLETENTKRNNPDNVKSLLSRNNNKNNSCNYLINNNRALTGDPLRKLSILSYEEKTNYLSTKNIKVKNKNKNKFLSVYSKDNINSIHYQHKSFKDLKQIFKDSIKRQKWYKSKGTNDLMPTGVDSDTRKKYFSQERNLYFNKIKNSKKKQYCKTLAKKCKKDENDLLINNIEDFRLKKLLKEYVENDNNLSEKFGDKFWLFSLRRNEKNDFLRLNYYNIGNKDREIWKKFIDYPDKDLELINSPYSNNKNRKSILLRFNKSYKGKLYTMPNLKGISEIKIEGKNLVEKEYNDIVDIIHSYKSNCRFKIYKDPKENKSKYINNFTYREEYNYKSNNNKNRSNKKKKVSFNKNKKNHGYLSK